MASTAQPNLILNLLAASDLSSSQYKAVKVDSSGTVAACGAAENAIGFLHNTPVSGAVCEIATFGGGARAKAGGTITAGDQLETDSNGDVIVATGAAENIVAYAVESAVDNDIFQIIPLFVKVASTA